MNLFLRLCFIFCIGFTISGCESDPGGKLWWMFFGWPILGIIYLIYSELTRPRPTKQQKEDIKRVKKLYQDAGYITYHISVHSPELFFVHLDKKKDENNWQRIQERVYIDIYKKTAYNDRTEAKNLPLPIPF